MSYSLRPYQLRGVDAVRAHLRSGRRRVLLVAPTGAGKTVIASHIIECSTGLGNRILFLAHRRELITQAFKKCIGCSCRPGYDHDTLMRDPLCTADGLPRKMVGVLMGDDRRRNPGAVVQVASVDTLRNRAKPHADLIIVDEAHRSLARTYQAIVAAYPEAAIIGLTATPYRADGRGLGDAYDELVVVASPRELIDQGALVEPRVFTVPAKDLPDLSRVRVKGGDYDEGQLAAAVDQAGLVGNIVEHWQRHAADLLTVVFAVNVEHSRHIVERFRAAGVAAEHLDGTTPTAERDAILARLERGETRVVSNCAVLTEGWDQPSVKCAVLARPTKSTGLFLQCAGRILRPWQNTGAIILDHAGVVLEHGLPQDDREFSLDSPKKRRTVTTTCKTCEACYAIVPLAARVCPACGAEFPVAEAEDKTEEKPGELVEVRPATVDEKRAAWDDICKTAVAKGYKPGWAFYRYKDKFGVAPPSSFKFPEVERPPATEAEKRAYVEQLRDTQQERGYSIGWIYQRYRVKFGEEVPAAWMMPRPAKVQPPSEIAMAVGDDFDASPGIGSVEEWPF
jgi:superfamily II DNA or RNA helicase